MAKSPSSAPLHSSDEEYELIDASNSSISSAAEIVAPDTQKDAATASNVPPRDTPEVKTDEMRMAALLDGLLLGQGKKNRSLSDIQIAALLDQYSKEEPCLDSDSEADESLSPEEEMLLAMPIGLVSGKDLQRAQEIVTRNAQSEQAARLRYQRMTPDQREKSDLRRKSLDDENQQLLEEIKKLEKVKKNLSGIHTTTRQTQRNLNSLKGAFGGLFKNKPSRKPSAHVHKPSRKSNELKSLLQMDFGPAETSRRAKKVLPIQEDTMSLSEEKRIADLLDDYFANHPENAVVLTDYLKEDAPLGDSLDDDIEDIYLEEEEIYSPEEEKLFANQPIGEINFEELEKACQMLENKAKRAEEARLRSWEQIEAENPEVTKIMKAAFGSIFGQNTQEEDNLLKEEDKYLAMAILNGQDGIAQEIVAKKIEDASLQYAQMLSKNVAGDQHHISGLSVAQNAMLEECAQLRLLQQMLQIGVQHKPQHQDTVALAQLQVQANQGGIMSNQMPEKPNASQESTTNLEVETKKIEKTPSFVNPYPEKFDLDPSNVNSNQVDEEDEVYNEEDDELVEGEYEEYEEEEEDEKFSIEGEEELLAKPYTQCSDKELSKAMRIVCKRYKKKQALIHQMRLISKSSTHEQQNAQIVQPIDLDTPTATNKAEMDAPMVNSNQQVEQMDREMYDAAIEEMTEMNTKLNEEIEQQLLRESQRDKRIEELEKALKKEKEDHEHLKFEVGNNKAKRENAILQLQNNESNIKKLVKNRLSWHKKFLVLDTMAVLFLIFAGSSLGYVNFGLVILLVLVTRLFMVFSLLDGEMDDNIRTSQVSNFIAQAIVSLRLPNPRIDGPTEPKPRTVTLKRDDDVVFGFDLLDAFVTFVKPSSIADKAGIQKGDRIVAVNGIDTMLASENKILRAIDRSGDQVKLVVQFDAKMP